MSVSEDYDIRVISRGKLRGGWAAHFVAVADVHTDPVDGDHDLSGEVSLVRRVRVAEYGFDRRDQAELVQNPGSTDIT
jgi:hypothetical protein